MRIAPAQIRFVWAMLFALVLAVRSLAPVGFMPVFDRGAVTIVACPDANAGAVPMMHHHHPASHGFAHSCPYAAASALGALGPVWAPLALALVFAVALSLGETFLVVEQHSKRERPPSRGPPILD